MEPVPLKAPALPDSGNNSTPGPSRQAANQQMVFDFTKRKRWADLLVTELTEAIMLVLSVTGQVWYCGPAIEELLGWRDEEIVDGDFCEIMNKDDCTGFQRQFTESIHSRGDLLSYVRLLCKTDDDLYPSIPLPVSGSNHTEFSQPQRQPPKEVLFEIKGYPHFVTKSKPSANDGLRGFLNSVERPAGGMIDPATGDEFKCFFAEAKPYPSRNTAMLNTFLELKIEHVRLQERVRLARERAESQSKPRQPPQSRYQPQSYLYPHQGHDGQHQDFERLFYSYGNETGDLPSGSVLPAVNSGANQNSGQDEADPDDQNLPRKKSRRQLAPQHLCSMCGRTDSPEWRKGPNGPKTLCNACGLRWAKSVRKDSALSPENHTESPGQHSPVTSHNAILSLVGVSSAAIIGSSNLTMGANLNNGTSSTAYGY